jgi:hypothetical protein
MERLQLVKKSEDTGDKLIAFVVRELTKLSGAAEVRSVESVAPGTAEGALFCDFDGQRRGAPGEDSGPGMDDLGLFHANSATASRGLCVKGLGTAA